jgi:hypothetical protein
MDDREINALATIMVKRHGKAAEAVARKRALRCRRMLEEVWAATWIAVADHLAKMEKQRRDE